MLNVIIVDNSNKAAPPLKNECPVCHFAILSAPDVEALKQFDCCFHCAMHWAEGHRGAWKNGWRPSADELDVYLSSRRLITFPIPNF